MDQNFLNCTQLLRSARKGNVLTPVCDSPHGGEGSLSRRGGVSVWESLSRGVSV